MYYVLWVVEDVKNGLRTDNKKRNGISSVVLCVFSVPLCVSS
jgi:hypothetical protein